MGKSAAQLNIRSDFARGRANELARATGMTTTQVVEEALRRFVPPPTPDELLPPGLIRKGRLLVLKGKGRTVTAEDVQRSIDEDREERGSVY